MKLLQKMFFITEKLEVSNVEQFFLQEGFEVDKETDILMFSKTTENNKVESFLLKSLHKRFNYCKMNLQEELKFSASLTDAISIYGFEVMEDNNVKVLKNDEYILIFSEFSENIYSITLAKQQKEFGEIDSVTINSIS